VLELRDVVKHYLVGDSERVRAVDGISLTVEPGELVTLYGPSGSGKTTLLMLVAALLTPDRGVVQIDGRDLSTLSERQAARLRLYELGFVRQALHLMESASVLDNAALKLLGTNLGVGEAHRRVAPLLERLGLGGRLEHRAEQLSMGERQRVLIARALSTEPKLMLADEPTSNLDSARAHQVLGLLGEICHERNTALLMVTHDSRAARHADRVHVLSDGTLAEYPPGELPAAVSAS
jgi:putative ABC transport system ATP-binding protein